MGIREVGVGSFVLSLGVSGLCSQERQTPCYRYSSDPYSEKTCLRFPLLGWSENLLGVPTGG